MSAFTSDVLTAAGVLVLATCFFLAVLAVGAFVTGLQQRSSRRSQPLIYSWLDFWADLGNGR